MVKLSPHARKWVWFWFYVTSFLVLSAVVFLLFIFGSRQLYTSWKVSGKLEVGGVDTNNQGLLLSAPNSGAAMFFLRVSPSAFASQAGAASASTANQSITSPSVRSSRSIATSGNSTRSALFLLLLFYPLFL